MRRVLVTSAPFDSGAELARLAGPDTGGTGCFIGTVRATDARGAPLAALHLEHYPGVTEAAMSRLADEAAARFGLLGVTIIHRVGRLAPGTAIVLAAAAAAHRAPALDATRFMADQLKTAIPLWKAEERPDGGKDWLAPTAADEAAARNWLETRPAQG
ncbi:molybdenum cofactor biosynthesis protein MoaE [Acidocella sp.]|uniref:molybdenum cofactor biosynthesis protein MoaE n=1 Tax=Acidocella sp. TaxID=50710 RepID=UPI00262A3F9B|nr:molybdenum cofactor biosynthesis protein MoaE [Acidocella sp.]